MNTKASNMTSSISAFIFDLDGVIVDSAQYHRKAWNRIASLFDFEITEKDNERLKGVSRVESLDLILEMAGKTIPNEEKPDLLIKKNDYYLEYIQKMDKNHILPGVADFIKEAKGENIKIGLGSASKNARPILEKLAIISLFDIIVDGNQTTKSKPDPQVFLMGAKGLDVEPKQSIVFEDSAAGLKAAKVGGFWAVGIGEASNLPEADVILPGFEKLTVDSLMGFLFA